MGKADDKVMENKNWFDKKIIDSGWDCPTCGEHLPSGIVGISSHWAECGGKEFHKELQVKIKDPNFGIEELQKLQEKHYGNTE